MTTTILNARAETIAPIVRHRSSPSMNRSHMVCAKGSAKTSAGSENSNPCFRLFRRAVSSLLVAEQYAGRVVQEL